MILIAGLLLVTLAAPQVHRIYYDEDIYANMGQNIAYTGQTGMANYGTFEYGEYFVNWLLYNKDPSGWPFLISLVFQLFGTDETYAFYLNNLLFAGGILIVFFIARILAGGWFAGLVAALIYALIPHNLVWSNTIAAENPAAVFGGLAVLCTLVWLRSRETRHLFLLAAVLPFACAMRPESAMIGLWALAAAALNLFSDAPAPSRSDRMRCVSRIPFATRVFWAMGLISFALVIPLIWHFYAMSGQSWGAEGAKFATSLLPEEPGGERFLLPEQRRLPRSVHPAGRGRPRGLAGTKERDVSRWFDDPAVVSALLGDLPLLLRGKLQVRRRCALRARQLHAACGAGGDRCGGAAKMRGGSPR